MIVNCSAILIPSEGPSDTRRFVLTIPPVPPAMWVSPLLFEQKIYNLVSS